MSGFGVIDPGILSQFQDAGRFGYHAMGLTTGGPVDGEAFYWANRLVGNQPGETVIEVAVGGLKLESEVATSIVVTGAVLPLTINGHTKALWQSHRVAPGDVVDLRYAERGMRAYVATAGGFTGRPVLGSTATVLREGIGEALVPGQILECAAIDRAPGALPLECVPRYEDEVPLRMVPGYQFDRFSHESREKFLGGLYTVSNRSDRMGICLEGPAVEAPSEGLLSEGICLGAVQVPPDGQPIVLMNDRQTIGGYPKLGSVLSADLWKLGQCRPGSRIRFETLALEKAVEVLQMGREAREAVELKESR
ncbi:MAG: biotin-dependent carboxyltransferase family protein [Verrucomicrobiota bacterium]|nr:biotin-dependent carboxyltransferase family protein [Verrucomicrobiota bacterium]